jgi:hypothetical protein
VVIGPYNKISKKIVDILYQNHITNLEIACEHSLL